MEQKQKNTLWTRDFTIITLGSMVSLLGSTLSGFAMSLMVLDRTDSTPLFALYTILYMLPSALAPMLAGPFLDRFSRKKTIYILDFITSGLFLIMTLVVMSGYFSYLFFAAMNILLGAIGGIYSVAYQSFYPLTITEGNFQRAYAVDSTLETLSAVMVPVSTFVYKTFGIVPLFMANCLTYLLAAIMETQLKTPEKYTKEAREGPKGLGRFTRDFREGMSYLFAEKGLLAIAVYFFFSSITGGVTGVVTLPYFRSAFENGEYVYMLVWGMGTAARVIGGIIHYRLKIPAKYKYGITLVVYVLTALFEGIYLYLPVPAMMALCFASGILGMTSYNIRISATQRYVPDERKGRFNGAFGTLNTVGSIIGEAAAGVMSLFLAERPMVTAVEAMVLVAALVIIGGNKKEISRVYSVEE